MENNHEYFMKEAIKEAVKAEKIGEVPVGCVIVKDNKIIARGYNKREKSQKTIMHAEIDAINKANKKLSSWRLDDTSIYVTLEPCPMCAGAIINARIKNLIFGAFEPKFGASKSITDLFSCAFNHEVNVTCGILEDEVKELMKKFFKELRKNK